MKTTLIPLTLLIVVSLPHAANSACTNKIDQSKVILFIDTNAAKSEIETAEKSACLRGERLVVIPKSSSELDQLSIRRAAAAKDLKMCSDKCSSKNENCANVCDQKIKTLAQIRKELETKSGDTGINNLTLRKELQKLQNEASKVVSLVISGHDGGGSFSGVKGGISYADIKSEFGNFPKVNQIRSAMLLGCYTNVKEEADKWKRGMPGLRFIAGYDDSAPLANASAGHEFLSQALDNESKILEQKDAKNLQSIINTSLASLDKLNGALYISLPCNDQEYYRGSFNRQAGIEKFNLSECGSEAFKKDIKDALKKFDEFYSGAKNPPQDTARGEMRKVYTQLRILSHCNDESGNRLPVDTAFRLVFFDAIKANFSTYFKNDIEKIIKKLKSSPEEIAKAKTDVAALQKELEGIEEKEWQHKALFNRANMEKDLAKYGPELIGLQKNPLYEKLKGYVTMQGYLAFPRDLPKNEVDYLSRLNEVSRKANFAKVCLINFENCNADVSRRMALDKDNASNKLAAANSRLSFFKLASDENKLRSMLDVKGKTRKQILDLEHSLTSYRSGFEGNDWGRFGALDWLENTYSYHLNLLRVPYSWHEVGADVEPAGAHFTGG